MRFFDICYYSMLLNPSVHNEAIVFDASEIATQLDLADTGDLTTYPAETYGVCAPPFTDRYFWIEATTKTRAPDNLSPSDLHDLLLPKDMPQEQILAELAKHEGTIARRGVLALAKKVNTDTTKWTIALRGYIQYDIQNAPFKTPVTNPDAVAYVDIDHDGYMLTDPSATPVSVSDPSNMELARLEAAALTNSLPFAFLALSFLHRRTVLDRFEPGRSDRKLASRLRGHRQGETHLANYYKLRVKPHEDGVSKLPLDAIQPLTARTMRKHHRRGHMRAVGPTGLFGKGYHADELIWIDESEPGDETKGVINKDYFLDHN